MCKKQMYDKSTGHIIVDFDGKRMLVDTAAAKTFYDEYQGVRIDDLSRVFGQPLDGVLGMDSFKGKVLSLTRDTIHLNGVPPDDHKGTPLNYISGIPCVDVKINQVPCRAIIKTAVTTCYISEALISRDKYTRFVEDTHPYYGNFRAKMFANYFSIGNKNYFADAGVLPGEFSLSSSAGALPGEFSVLSSSGVDAIIGTDVLNRFELIMDFTDNRLHLISN